MRHDAGAACVRQRVCQYLQRRSKSDPLANTFQIHWQLGSGGSCGGIEIQCGAHGFSQRVVGRKHSLSPCPGGRGQWQARMHVTLVMEVDVRRGICPQSPRAGLSQASISVTPLPRWLAPVRTSNPKVVGTLGHSHFGLDSTRAERFTSPNMEIPPSVVSGESRGIYPNET